MPASRRSCGAVAPVLAGALLVGACSGVSGAEIAPPSASPTAAATAPTSSPGPAPARTPAAGLAARAGAAGRRGPWSARYRLVGDAAQPVSTVTIAVRGNDLRLDLVRGRATSVLLITATGTVSCQLTGARRTCLQAAGPGAAIPRVLDPGLQRVFTSDLAALVAGRAVDPTPGADLPATASLPAARCWQVAAAPGLDAGTYCLTADGQVRQATFAAGTLALIAALPPPAASRFRAPASPKPLPSPSRS